MRGLFHKVPMYGGLAIVLIMLLFPFVNDSRSILILFTQIFIFAIFAMSFDILLGYTGIVSFGHCMFFGIGAYSTAIIFNHLEANLLTFMIGLVYRNCPVSIGELYHRFIIVKAQKPFLCDADIGGFPAISRSCGEVAWIHTWRRWIYIQCA